MSTPNSLTDITYWTNHTVTQLVTLRDRMESDVSYMLANGGEKMALEAEAIAATIRATLILRAVTA